jgi:uncharacterized repeat protein (TIGR03803 family)
LIQAGDGTRFGTTFVGGAANRGTVFNINPAGALTTVHSFAFGEGANPQAGLIQASDGTFYGTTFSGGAANRGTVFKLDAPGGLTPLHSLVSGEGANPQGGLIQASDGNFYGTTIAGGASNRGTIFRMDPAGTLTTLHSFNVGDGADPYGGVIQGTDGSFYGTTDKGGLNDSGVVFRLTVELPTTTTLTVSPTPSMFGQSVTLTASVTIGRATPTGSVAFFDGSNALGTATLTGGTAALHTTTLAAGSHELRAEYAGVTKFAPSTSAMVTHIVVLPATFINPVNHATNVDLTRPFTWTSVAGAQAYYLYVGTSAGAKDLVNTGEIQQTSYRVPLTLATGATLYARLWTKAGGMWRLVDAAFSAPPIARFTYPDIATTTVDATLPLTWTAVPAAKAPSPGATGSHLTVADSRTSDRSRPRRSSPCRRARARRTESDP